MVSIVFFNLDDLDVRNLIRNQTEEILNTDQPLTIDEVQKEPQALTDIKRFVDKKRRPGQFLLTGSANLLMMKKVSKSLAGRAGYLYLEPMTLLEQTGQGQSGF